MINGSGVYWYAYQKAYCSASRDYAEYVNAAVELFSSKEVLAKSCAKGKSNSFAPLNETAVNAIVGMYSMSEENTLSI